VGAYHGFVGDRARREEVHQSDEGLKENEGHNGAHHVKEHVNESGLPGCGLGPEGRHDGVDGGADVGAQDHGGGHLVADDFLHRQGDDNGNGRRRRVDDEGQNRAHAHADEGRGEAQVRDFCDEADLICSDVGEGGV